MPPTPHCFQVPDTLIPTVQTCLASLVSRGTVATWTNLQCGNIVSHTNRAKCIYRICMSINIYRQFSASPQVWGSLRLALIIYHFAEQKWYLLPACSIWLCVKLQSKQTYGIHMIHNTIYIHTQKIHHELPRVRSGSPQLLDNCTSFITWTYVVHCYWSKFHGCPCLSFKLKCISTPYSWFHEIQILST